MGVLFGFFFIIFFFVLCALREIIRFWRPRWTNEVVYRLSVMLNGGSVTSPSYRLYRPGRPRVRVAYLVPMECLRLSSSLYSVPLTSDDATARCCSLYRSAPARSAESRSTWYSHVMHAKRYRRTDDTYRWDLGM